MIILNPNGGLGNQMYDYAYAQALSEEYGEDVYLNTLWIKLNQFVVNIKHMLYREKKEHVEYLLGCLYCADDLKKMNFFSALFHAVRLEIFIIQNTIFCHVAMQERVNLFLINTEKGYFGPLGAPLTYFEASKCKRKYKYVFGCPSSEKYFIKISKQLRSKLKVSMKQNKENEIMMTKIKSCNSVCLHVRRGDYYNNPSYAYLRICTEAYYQNCISYIKKHCENPVFFVFSNNTEELCWVKENYKLEGDIIYVDLNNPNYEELRLMYSCKHFIISNSTFSWWASFLAENPDKIVLAPEKWFMEYEGSVDVYRDDMIKISIETENECLLKK